jgi:dTDP-4-dehydrorhamnose reductase
MKEKKTILVLGGNGTVGHKMYQVLSKKYDTFATIRTYSDTLRNMGVFKRDRVIENVDVFNMAQISAALDQLHPDCVINCIGIVKQSVCASDPVLTIYTNALFPHLLARECGKRNIRMIEFTTDCVFNGKKGNYTEQDIPNAEDLYGRTKHLGEVVAENCLTIRTSYIGHELTTHYGLLEWFLQQKEKAKGYSKAIYTGFSSVELSRIIRDIVIPDDSLHGLYHVSSDPIAKYDLLHLIAKEYGKKIVIERDDSVVIDRSLNSDPFQKITGYKAPDWPDMVKDMHADYVENYRETAS